MDIIRRELPSTQPPPSAPPSPPTPIIKSKTPPIPEPRPGIEAPLIRWSASEYDFIPKSREWYWAIGILVVGLIIVAGLIHNLLFGILVVLAGFTIALYSARRPRIIAFAITARGVEIGNTLHPYESLESFWIRYNPPQIKELDIISKKMTSPRITIPLGDADPTEIRNILVKTLKEIETNESLAESIGRYLGF